MEQFDLSISFCFLFRIYYLFSWHLVNLFKGAGIDYQSLQSWGYANKSSILDYFDFHLRNTELIAASLKPF